VFVSPVAFVSSQLSHHRILAGKERTVPAIASLPRQTTLPFCVDIPPSPVDIAKPQLQLVCGRCEVGLGPAPTKLSERRLRHIGAADGSFPLAVSPLKWLIHEHVSNST